MPVIGVGLLALVISTPVAHRIFAAVLVVLAVLACTIGLRYMQRD